MASHWNYSHLNFTQLNLNSMKNLVFITLVCICLISLSCQQKIDYDAESKAIKEVIMQETRAWAAQDYPALAACFVKDSTTTRMETGSMGHSVWFGWDENLGPYYKKATQTDWTDYKILGYRWSNWHIKVYPESAWAIYNQHTRYTYMDEEGESKSCEIRFLENVNGKWKIVMLHWIDLVHFDEAKKAMEEAAGQ